MKTNLIFIGIDVSKSILDIYVLTCGESRPYRIANQSKAIRDFFIERLKVDQHCHICMENTGKYGWTLMGILCELSCHFYVVNPLHLHRSLGLIRGSDDPVSALRIAQFIKKNYDQLTPYIPRRAVVESLHLLVCERSYKVKQRRGLKTKNKDLQVLPCTEVSQSLMVKNDELILQLTLQIKAIEAQIKDLIREDDKLHSLEQHLRSVPGVGEILAWNVLIKTNEFISITEPRKLACYAGVAPFSKRLGTSVFGRSRVSLCADKSLKKLLHLAAMSAIRLENDLSVFYHRKVKEGKNKMSVLNAVRNKIIHIIFALVKNQTFYQNRLVVS